MKLAFLLLSILIPASVYCQLQEEVKTERSPNGVVRVQYSFYRDDKGKEVWHGKRIEWTENGKKFSEGTYRDGKAEGLRTYWHENGRKSSEGYYHNDKPVGVWLHWYPDGQLAVRCPYSHGQRHGTCLKWNEKNREVEKVKYINGKPLAIVRWEKQNPGLKDTVYLYPYMVVRPDSIIFISKYAGISRIFTLDELETVFTSLPKSVWVIGKVIGLGTVGVASADERKKMDQVLAKLTAFLESKGYVVELLPS